MNGGVERTGGEGEEAAEEIISVHSTAFDMDVAVDDCFIGREWGGGAACLCTDASCPQIKRNDAIKRHYLNTTIDVLLVLIIFFK